ncbi:hypothetical protein B0H14DRAFT_2588823 [Mycena olivaceomarginata]|nr:hypothetical protein B0H14DRAFT_2588823 [Mycena olivaceomarginata]
MAQPWSRRRAARGKLAQVVSKTQRGHHRTKNSLVVFTQTPVTAEAIGVESVVEVKVKLMATFRKSIRNSGYNGIRTQVDPQIGSNIPVVGGFESCRVVVVVNRIDVSNVVTTRLSIDIAKRELGTEMTQRKMTAEPIMELQHGLPFITCNVSAIGMGILIVSGNRHKAAKLDGFIPYGGPSNAKV